MNSSYVDATSGSVEHCEAMAQQFPDLAQAYYGKMATACQGKLWHQLTLVVLDFLETSKENTLRPMMESSSSSSNSNNTHLSLYQNIVLKVAPKLNSLALARMASAVARNSLENTSTTSACSVEQAKALLQDLIAQLKTQQAAQEELDQHKTNKSDLSVANIPTTLLLESQLALLSMSQGTTNMSKEDLGQIYATIKTNAPKLKKYLSPDTHEALIVNSSHYDMSMTYFKWMGPPELYYDEAIHYLNYYQPTEDNQVKSHALAVDLCLAALTGEGVYNLGQVVSNPILKVLIGTPEAWLMELLQACSKGSVSEFKMLCQTTYASQIAAQPALTNMGQALQEKMTLLALVEMVFERPASERTLAFDDICARLEIPLEQVEWVIMRACSVKLLEGSMDQVEGTVHVTWVLPRVLSEPQMADLAVRFGAWATKVSTTNDFMKEQTPTLTA